MRRDLGGWICIVTTVLVLVRILVRMWLMMLKLRCKRGREKPLGEKNRLSLLIEKGLIYEGLWSQEMMEGWRRKRSGRGECWGDGGVERRGGWIRRRRGAWEEMA